MRCPPARDTAVAAVLLVVVLVWTEIVSALVPASGPVGAAGVLCVVAASLACAWRTTAPAFALLVVSAVVAAYLALDQAYGPVQLLVTVMGVETGRRRPVGRSLAVAVGSSVLLVAALSVRADVVARTSGAGDATVATAVVGVAWPAVFVVIPVLAGALVRARTQAVARGREELLARGAAEERMRVAREVHDVAGHGFAVVAMQAGVALTVLDEDLAQARRSLEAVRDTAQRALDELHTTLAALRAEPLDLAVLVERVRRAGVAVELHVEGDPGALGQDVAEGVHRVVQEALTNVVRHAGPTSASVAVTHDGAGVASAITVALADDDELIRMGLRVLVDREDDLALVGEAADGHEALALVRRLRPDVLLLDLQMPGLDGIGVLRAIAADPDLASTRVVVVTTFEIDRYVVEALQHGAGGFLLKGQVPAELVRAIRVVAAGEALLSPSVTRRVVGLFGRGLHGPTPPPLLWDSLTAREREMVAWVTTGRSNEEIAGELVISPDTVRTHVSRAMVKLGARDRAQLVVFAVREGVTRAEPT